MLVATVHPPERNRTDYVLAVLAAAQGRPLTPVQVQKLYFILDKRIGPLVGGPFFEFSPYHYGPFDANVYREIEGLAAQGLAEVSTGAMRMFRISPQGYQRGLAAFSQLAPSVQDYVRSAVNFVLSKSFAELVSAVYAEWPEMRSNSIFRDPAG